METLDNQETCEKVLLNKRSTDILETLDEDGVLKFCGNLRRLDKCENPDRVKIKNQDGENYLVITVSPLDCSDGVTERAEIQAKNKLNYDEEYKQNFSFKIPEDFVLDGNRLVIGQWKRSPAITENGDDAPLLSQRIRMDEKGQLYFVVTDGYRKEFGKKISIEAIRGKWIDMTYKIKFSDKETSYVSIKATCEGKDIKIYEGPLNIPHPKEENSLSAHSYFKFGIYRDIHEDNQTESILFKDYKMKKVEE